jgi:hypothetical protein
MKAFLARHPNLLEDATIWGFCSTVAGLWFVKFVL